MMSFSISQLVLPLAQTIGQPPAGQGMDHTTMLIWGIVLLGMAMALFIVEMFVPSAGIIGLIGSLCLIGGVVLLFRVDTTVGLLGAAVSLAAIPFIILLGMKLWPDMPLARWLILRHDKPDDENVKTAQADASSPAVAPGGTGRAITDLHPVGICLIEGNRIECLASQGMIEAGAPVRIVAVDGMQIKVVKQSLAVRP